MPPPPGYLRMVDLCEELDLSPNTVKKILRRLREVGSPVEPIRSGTMALFTREQADAIQSFIPHSLKDSTANGKA